MSTFLKFKNAGAAVGRMARATVESVKQMFSNAKCMAQDIKDRLIEGYNNQSVSACEDLVADHVDNGNNTHSDDL